MHSILFIPLQSLQKLSATEILHELQGHSNILLSYVVNDDKTFANTEFGIGNVTFLYV